MDMMRRSDNGAKYTQSSRRSPDGRFAISEAKVTAAARDTDALESKKSRNHNAADIAAPKDSIKRRNSTGTIYIDSTMSLQDNDATIRCVCAVIRAHLLEAERENIEPRSEFNTFKDKDEEKTTKPNEVSVRYHCIILYLNVHRFLR